MAPWQVPWWEAPGPRWRGRLRLVVLGSYKWDLTGTAWGSERALLTQWYMRTPREL